jgi:hypothetical protein
MVVRSFGNAIAGFKDIFGKTGARASKEYVVTFSATSSGTIATPATGLAPGNGYVYHTFTGPGTFTVSSGSKNIELLIVGGGGGSYAPGGYGGGGGAGGLIYYGPQPSTSTAASFYTLTQGPYSITVGTGGPASSPGSGSNGNPSSFGPIIAYGGGGANVSSGTFGSGGSGYVGYNGQPSITAGSGTPGQGFPGGTGNQIPAGGAAGGGGGGAGAAGNGDSSPGNRTAGSGGNGLQFPAFTGPLIGVPSLAPLSGYFAGGGAGIAMPTGYGWGGGTSGGLGGGGGSAPGDSGSGSPGITNSGGGGGSGGGGTSGSGGPGIIIIRYLAS